jgi:hypothetical protein
MGSTHTRLQLRLLSSISFDEFNALVLEALTSKHYLEVGRRTLKEGECKWLWRRCQYSSQCKNKTLHTSDVLPPDHVII